MKSKRKIDRKHKKILVFELVFIAIVVILIVVKLMMPHFMHYRMSLNNTPEDIPDTLLEQSEISDELFSKTYILPHDLQEEANAPKHPLLNITNYQDTFPDINPVQLATASTFGAPPLQSREDIGPLHGTQLFYMAASPYYRVANLENSVPYLTPKAQKMLNMIGRNFMDSLCLKQISPAQILVTSVTRTIEDVANLQKVNRNATTNSCHSYGTTVDISYNNFQPLVKAPGDTIPIASADILRRVLAEVLVDLRNSGACFVKYERRQSCFHITVK